MSNLFTGNTNNNKNQFAEIFSHRGPSNELWHVFMEKYKKCQIITVQKCLILHVDLEVYISHRWVNIMKWTNENVSVIGNVSVTGNVSVFGNVSYHMHFKKTSWIHGKISLLWKALDSHILTKLHVVKCNMLYTCISKKKIYSFNRYFFLFSQLHKWQFTIQIVM